MGLSLRNLPFFNALFQSSPPYHVGSTFENRIGAQLARIFSIYTVYNLRSAPAYTSDPEYLKKVKEEGMIIIPDFLSPEDWATVKQEYENFLPKMPFRPYYKSANPSMKVATKILNDSPEEFPNTLRILGKNKIINDLAGVVIRKDVNKQVPELSYLVLEKDDRLEYDDDVENILHADVHYPTVKAFFYLEPVTKKNGAYIYAPGSHKMSMARLKYEYNMSVRWAKLKSGNTNIPEKYLQRRGETLRSIISDDERAEMKVTEFRCEGAPNTLVLSNNAGFHRRGEFEANERRAILLVNFRKHETSWLRRQFNKRNKGNKGNEMMN